MNRGGLACRAESRGQFWSLSPWNGAAEGWEWGVSGRLLSPDKVEQEEGKDGLFSTSPLLLQDPGG